MRKIALLTCTVICLLVILSGVECWSEIRVQKEYSLPSVEGRFFRPRISGDWIVALQQDTQNKTTTTLGVHCINLINNQIYTVYTGKASWPAISGTLAVWPGCSDNIDSLKGRFGKDSKLSSRLIMLDLSTWSYFAPTLSTRSAGYMTVSGKHVAYELGCRIYLLDAITGVNKRISDNEAIHRNPEINGDFIVWEDVENKTESQVVCYQISTGRQFDVTDSASQNNRGPSTDGKHIVWWGKDGVGVYDIATRNSFNIPSGHYVDVDNGIVVYLKRTDMTHVFGTEIATGKEFQISKGAADQGPSISNGKVIWCNKGLINCAVLDLKANDIVPLKKDTPLTKN